VIELESLEPYNESMMRNARRLGLVFLAYAIGLPLLVLVFEPLSPPDTGAVLISWVLIMMMPIETLLVYGSYRFFSKKGRFQNIMGPAILMYTFGIAPSIYAFVIGFIYSDLRYIAISLGLMFSIVALWLSLTFISRLWDASKSTDL
jgi:hypothetical protein